MSAVAPTASWRAGSNGSPTASRRNEAESCQHANRLLVHGANTLEDCIRIGGGVLQRQLEVVDDREPLARDPRHVRPPVPRSTSRAHHFLQVVEVGERPAPSVVELPHPPLELGNATRRIGVGLGLALVGRRAGSLGHPRLSPA